MKQHYISGKKMSLWMSLVKKWKSLYNQVSQSSNITKLSKLNKLSLTLGIKRKIAIASLAMFATLGVQAQVSFEKDNSANPLFPASIDAGTYSNPVLVDFDADGDLDLVSGEYYGAIKYFQNNGGTFVEQLGHDSPFDGIDVGYRSAPDIVDIDGDGDLDLISGNYDGDIKYYQNNMGVFTEQTSNNNPFDGISAGYYTSTTFVDFDSDGDLDLIIGSDRTSLAYYENDDTGKFILQTDGDNPFEEFAVTYGTDVAIADIDMDGDLDIISGSRSGRIEYFTYDSSNDEYVIQSGNNNPFLNLMTDINLDYASPTFADLNGDGKLDLVIGNNDGSFIQFNNTTPGTITDVSNNEEKTPITIYPNPTSSQLFVEAKGEFQVLDATGVVLIEGNVDNSKIDVSTLNTGCYFLNVAGVETSFIKK